MSIATDENRKAVVALATEAGARVIVEIGVRRGRLSKLLLKIPTCEKLHLVDNWQDDFDARLYDRHRIGKNARAVKRWSKRDDRVTIWHEHSEEARHRFPRGSIDFLYIDGDHSRAGVTADIENYLPKIRSGGIISGDDYDLPSVKEAVDALLPHRQVHANGRLWWAIR